MTAASDGARVREVAVPPAARTLSTLPRIDYADAFVVDTRGMPRLTGEEWARRILADAPAPLRSSLRRGWATLGLRLGPADSQALVLGWKVRRSNRDFALLAGSSPLGLRAELLLKPERQALLFCTILQHRNPLARAVWAGVAPLHRPVVRHVLKQAARRVASQA